jgi:5-formyltetrahydrofolate cyclo-ligase
MLKDPERELTLGPWGILEPKGEFYRPFPLEEIDVVIVPGVAFDERGNRLGFGRGFYDKFLRRLSERVSFVALAFELQVVRRLPSQSHDVAVDYIITEKRIIKCKPR